MKRVGEKGEDKWEEISWEQAIDEISTKLMALKEKYGAKTLFSSEGTYRPITCGHARASSISLATPATLLTLALSAGAGTTP